MRTTIKVIGKRGDRVGTIEHGDAWESGYWISRSGHGTPNITMHWTGEPPTQQILERTIERFRTSIIDTAALFGR